MDNSWPIGQWNNFQCIVRMVDDWSGLVSSSKVWTQNIQKSLKVFSQLQTKQLRYLMVQEANKLYLNMCGTPHGSLLYLTLDPCSCVRDHIPMYHHQTQHRTCRLLNCNNSQIPPNYECAMLHRFVIFTIQTDNVIVGLDSNQTTPTYGGKNIQNLHFEM